MFRQRRYSQWELRCRVNDSILFEYHPKLLSKNSIFFFRFGVCCVFTISTGGTTTSENCSYIQNPSYPSVYSATSSLTYTVEKCSDEVCAIRLDFETMTIAGPSSSAEVNGGACTDSFVATGTSGITTPTICGKNTGAHLYIDVGATSTDTAKLTFTFSGTSTVRTWDIKATQIPCAANYRPPGGCLQWHTGLTGRFTTFNFLETTTPQHLASQDYSICIRGEEDYCCIAYEKCSDANSFTIKNDGTGAVLDTNCLAEDYIGIDGAQATCDQGFNAQLHTKLCGVNFNVADATAIDLTFVCDCSAPFIVDIYTDAIADDATATSRGVCLEYRQIQCTN